VDHISELGALAIATRIRRVLEQLLKDGKRVYQEAGVAFEVRWFAVFHLLTERSPLTVTEIAKSLGQSHPTVIEVIEEMIERGLLRSSRDDVDGRRRQIGLTAEGRRLAKQLQPIWLAFGEAGREVTTEGGNDFVTSLGKLESALAREPMFERVSARLLKNKGEDNHDKQEHTA
jgi:DNA-binding MarR family transcriptional regulator